MAFIIGKIKCVFCGWKTGVFKSIHKYGIYGDLGKRIFYHDECLQMVEESPELYGHKNVDMAININDLHSQNKRDINDEIVVRYEKKKEELAKHNFERMMPKK